MAVVVKRPDRTELIVVPAFFGGEPRLSVPLNPVPEVRALRWIANVVYVVVTSGANWRSLVRADLERRVVEPLSDDWKLPGELRSLDVSPDGRRVVLAVSASGREDLWESAIDGSSLRRLTDDAYFERAPVWSGDGGSILYQSNRGGPVDLWELAASTGRLRQLTSSDTQERPGGTSADGSLIAFHQESEDAKLWRWHAGTRDGQPLVGDVPSDFSPSASSDGRVIVFQRHTPSPSHGFLILDTKLMVGELSTGGWTAAPQARADGFAGVLSPDGSHLAYYQRGDKPSVMTLKVRQLASDRDVTVSTRCRPPVLTLFPIGWVDRLVAWSPNGDALYFVEQHEAQVIRRFVPGAAASDDPLIAAAPGETIRDLFPSRDGRSLAYLVVQRSDFVLRTVDLATRVVRDWSRGAAGRGAVYIRGWVHNDTALAVVRTVEADFTADVELLVARPAGLESVTHVTRTLAATTRLDPSGSTMYVTRVEKGVHNIYAVPLPPSRGAPAPLTTNTLQGVSFSAVMSIGADQLIGVRHERRKAIWLIHTSPAR
jgi:Tol biopolymer transport system component